MKHLKKFEYYDSDKFNGMDKSDIEKIVRRNHFINNNRIIRTDIDDTMDYAEKFHSLVLKYIPEAKHFHYESDDSSVHFHYSKDYHNNGLNFDIYIGITMLDSDYLKLELNCSTVKEFIDDPHNEMEDKGIMEDSSFYKKIERHDL